MADSGWRRRLRRVPRARLSAKRLRQRDAQDAYSACNTISDILQITGGGLTLVAMPREYDTAFVLHIGPVAVTIVPTASRVYLKAEGLNERALETVENTGEIPLGQLEQFVAYLGYAGVHVPHLRPDTLPTYARTELYGSEETPVRQRPSLSVVPSPPQPATPLINQRSLPPRQIPGNQRQEYAQI